MIMIDRSILSEIRGLFAAAAVKGDEEAWAVCIRLIEEKGTDWQVLAAITEVTAELFRKNAVKGNRKLADAFQGMNDMAFDYAYQHRDEIDYNMFRDNSREWMYEAPDWTDMLPGKEKHS